MLVDKKHKAAYMTGLRNGSTLINEIQDIVGPERLGAHEYPEDLYRMLTEDRSYKIYMPFRDPMIRFKSALTVNMYNRCTLDTDSTGNTENYIFYKAMLRYLDNSVGTDNNIFNWSYHRPYHLFDTHTDHILYKPLIHLAFGFDVHMIPFNKFSDHLLERFPEAEPVIKKRGRVNSFDTSMPTHERAWNVYKEVFVDDDPDFFKHKLYEATTLTFDTWMRPELKIFELLMENHQQLSILKTKCRGLIKHFVETNQYFNDPYSPKFMELGTIVPIIERFTHVNRDLYDTMQRYKTIGDNLKSLRIPS